MFQNAKEHVDEVEVFTKDFHHSICGTDDPGQIGALVERIRGMVLQEIEHRSNRTLGMLSDAAETKFGFFVTKIGGQLFQLSPHLKADGVGRRVFQHQEVEIVFVLDLSQAIDDTHKAIHIRDHHGKSFAIGADQVNEVADGFCEGVVQRVNDVQFFCFSWSSFKKVD